MEQIYLTPRSMMDEDEIDRKDALLRKCRDTIETLTQDLETERALRLTSESKCEVLETKFFNYNLEISARDETIERLQMESANIDDDLIAAKSDLNAKIVEIEYLNTDIKYKTDSVQSLTQQLKT